ncbi:MAG: hypothetical protein KIT09_13305 [Bryobacteraceae bacterium]|nr:hypothetical protein [Bryobacteraceae bacterium]
MANVIHHLPQGDIPTAVAPTVTSAVFMNRSSFWRRPEPLEVRWAFQCIRETQVNPEASNASEAPASSAENLFVEVFQDAVGLLNAQWLQFQVPFTDLDSHQRWIDYALPLLSG